MMRIVTLPWMLVLFTGCVSNDLISDDRHIEDFNSLRSHVGQRASVSGIVSLTHGAAGIYFNNRDLRNENNQCIIPVPFEGYRHGERVRLFGLIRKTECGSRMICLNACDGYELISSYSDQ